MDPMTIKLTLDPETALQLQTQKPRSLPTATFCALLIEEGLDIRLDSAKNGNSQRSATQAQAELSESFQTPSVREGGSLRGAPSSNKKLDFATVELPAELATARDKFIEFGKVKKGDRGQHGAKLAATGLTKIGKKYGWDVAIDQLDLAINNRWAGISLNNYEKFLPKDAMAAQTQNNHPAARVFTAADFDMPNPDNPLKDLF